MSQVVTLKRNISREDLCVGLDQVENLSLGAEHDWGFSIEYACDPNSLVTFSNGEVDATSPSDDLLQKLEILASLLGAEVVLEDEVIMPPSGEIAPRGREIVLFWPVLVLVLVGLLVWRW